MARVHLTETQREAIRRGSRLNPLGAAETGVQGSTMQALARKGMAEVRWTRKPYPRLVYVLTSAGVAENQRLARARLTVDAIDALHPPTVSEGVTCRCTHCGAVFEDATPGGSCGRCGLEVRMVCPDDGACYHECSERCWRVSTCEPLTGAGWGSEWPEEIRRRHAETSS